MFLCKKNCRRNQDNYSPPFRIPTDFIHPKYRSSTTDGHGFTRMPGSCRKSPVHPEGEWKILSEIRVYPCSSVVNEIFVRLQLRNPGSFAAQKRIAAIAELRNGATLDFPPSNESPTRRNPARRDHGPTGL
jgi:hypothetical protein